MIASEFAIEQRKLMVDQFEQARRYVNIILVAGYAGLFALWTGLEDYLSPLAKLSSGLLACISVIVFLAWEMYSLVKRQEIMTLTRMMIEEPSRFERGFDRIQKRLLAIVVQVNRSWWKVFPVASLTAAIAYFVILSSLAAELMTQLAPRLSTQEILILMNTIWIAAGITLGAVFVILFVRVDAWWTRRTSRRHFAEALSAELQTFQELVRGLAENWQSDGIVEGECLQEIAYSRRTFDDNRSALHLLDIPELQTQLNEFYRKSFGLLSRLQVDSNYHLTLIRSRSDEGSRQDQESERERIEKEISARISRLNDLRSEAENISQKLQSYV